MSHTRRSRYSPRSPSPYHHRNRYSISLSRSPSRSRRSRSRSRSCDPADVVNPGNNLYVTGLSSQVSKAELEDHFASKGKVVDIHLVVDPYTRESRGFGFVTMARIEDAERCIKYLDGSILNGRVITVEKAITHQKAQFSLSIRISILQLTQPISEEEEFSSLPEKVQDKLLEKHLSETKKLQEVSE